MLKKMMVRFCLMCVLAFALTATAFAEIVGIFFDSKIEQINFAAGDIKSALESKQYTVEMLPLTSLKASYAKKKIVIALASDNTVNKLLKKQGGTIPSGLVEQAYALQTTSKAQKSYWVIGGDVNGAMYGGIEISEQITSSGLSGNYNNQESPFLKNRGMKLNMPLDRRIPTYVGGWSSTSTTKAIPHVWDMTFWKKLIDQQARYRYNVLSVWTHHPFPALVKLADYPNACLPRIEGFDGFVKEINHEQRVAFWREVMQYAHSRGMKFFFFNWNVYLDYAKDQYPDLTQKLSNNKTIEYMNKCMKALLETYPELDGWGISAGDGMSDDSYNNTSWTYNAMGKPVKEYLAANPSRKFTLIHRSIYSNPELCDTVYAAPLKSVPNCDFNYSVKYAQAHMYSTTTPKWTEMVESCSKIGMKTWLTIRNDDYFYINWGDPQFVRDYMAGIPEKQSIVGMYIGSDGYTPSRTYFYKNPALNGQLEVERRWYMEMLWGRISYNPKISNDVFKNMFAKRFPTVSADNLFQAWTLASRPLPKVTELIMDKWSLDFQWYPEGNLSDPGRGTGFRTIDDYANLTSVAKGSNLCDIANSAAGTCNGKKDSFTVADEMQTDAEKALALVNTMSSGGNTDLELAINNIKQMSFLSMYYAHKVRGATFKKAGQLLKAKDEMAKAYCWWMSYTRSMEVDYYGDSFRNMQIKPNWKFGDAAVLKEYTDLGGVGAPICGDRSFKVTISADDDSKGSVLGAGLYNPGDDVTVTAVPKSGFRFLRWMENNAIVSSDLSYKFELNADKQIIACFIEAGTCGFPWNNEGLKINNTTVNKIIGPIDISCAQNGVTISANIEGLGTDNSDYCKLFYKVDGDVQKPIAELTGKFDMKTVSVSNIKGKILEIIISSSNSFGDEIFNITNIKIDNVNFIK